MKKIYVLVQVTYDHYEFIETFAASENKDKLYDFIKTHTDNNLPVFEDNKEYNRSYLLQNEKFHWLIKEFENL